jgi:hypothetical protein
MGKPTGKHPLEARQPRKIYSAILWDYFPNFCLLLYLLFISVPNC